MSQTSAYKYWHVARYDQQVRRLANELTRLGIHLLGAMIGMTVIRHLAKLTKRFEIVTVARWSGRMQHWASHDITLKYIVKGIFAMYNEKVRRLETRSLITRDRHCTAKMPRFMMPRYYRAVPVLPLTPTGKNKKTNCAESG